MKKRMISILAAVLLFSTATACQNNGGAGESTVDVTETERTRRTIAEETTTEAVETTIETTVETTMETTPVESSALELDAGVSDNPLFGLSVEETIDIYVTAKKNLDEELLIYFGDDASVPTGNIGVEAQIAVENIAYTIAEISEDGDTATVKMSFTNKDMGKIAIKYFQTVGEKMVEAGQNPSEETIGKIMEEAEQAMAEEVGNSELVTIDVELILTKKDGVWMFEEESMSLENAMFGGVVDGMAEAIKSALAAR